MASGKTFWARRHTDDRDKKDQEKAGYFRRDWLVYILLGGLFIAIIVKLSFIQIVEAAEIQAKRYLLASAYKGAVVPKRGSIIDAQGNVLASSIEVRELFLDPITTRDFLQSSRNTRGWTKEKIADTLAEKLNLSRDAIRADLDKETQWVRLGPSVDLTLAQEIMALNIEGIGASETYRRLYPMETLASSVLGIVTNDGNGVEGLEYSYNAELLGKTGTGINSLKLTLDATIQFLIEQQIADLVEKYNPDRICVLAMDPKTGKILGDGSYPTFDPNHYGQTSAEARKNMAVSMIYEPGSVFKVITSAAAIEESIVSQTEKFTDPGYLRVGPLSIVNWDSDQRAHGQITLAEGMSFSSNVVLAQVGLRMGKDIFYTYLRSFGFGALTRVDLPNEEIGLLIDKSRVRDIELATMSFGQANMVTPLQLLTGICAVANGGTLYKPYIVDALYNENGRLIQQKEPQVQRQILSEETCRMMTNILVNVVDRGTGSRAKIDGIKVAGKTGTAQKIDSATLQYFDDNFIVSFVGYAPADDPKIAVLVAVDNPKAQVVQGGSICAPRVKNIIEGALQYYGTPVHSGTESDIKKFVSQTPKETKPQVSYEPERALVKGEVLVPDLSGMTIRQAGDALTRAGLAYAFNGTGFAVRQSPEPGRIVNVGDRIEVIFAAQSNSSSEK